MEEPPILADLELVKKHLGGHQGHPDQRWLHKEEVFCLLMWAGRCAGFTVKTELPVMVPNGLSGEIDCGWFNAAGRLVVAWEVDGRDVGDIHVLGTRGARPRAGTLEKLEASSATIKFQVLYSLCNDLSAKRPSREATLRACFPPTVQVITDMALMTSGVLDRIVKSAQDNGDRVSS